MRQEQKKTGQAPSLLQNFALCRSPAFAARFTSLLSLRGFTTDELVEVALLPASGLVLMQQRKAVLIEGLEPIVPADALERTGAAESREVEADHAGIAALPRSEER